MLTLPLHHRNIYAKNLNATKTAPSLRPQLSSPYKKSETHLQLSMMEVYLPLPRLNFHFGTCRSFLFRTKTPGIINSNERSEFYMSNFMKDYGCSLHHYSRTLISHSIIKKYSLQKRDPFPTSYKQKSSFINGLASSGQYSAYKLKSSFLPYWGDCRQGSIGQVQETLLARGGSFEGIKSLEDN